MIPAAELSSIMPPQVHFNTLGTYYCEPPLLRDGHITSLTQNAPTIIII